MGALAQSAAECRRRTRWFYARKHEQALRRFFLNAALIFFAMYTAVTTRLFFVAVAVLWELVT